ncbi:MAG: beta-ketoacyl-ACP synthase II [Dehalococcoidia bacterium]|nr:beta-ketoacyl-ACP synthase II [Chloroflexota bacterium]MCK4242101.1 beta-ketoacyl-ACP synthase II [Dehalococcoidia bacterium]
MNKKVVVTGLGTVNPLGLDVASTWRSLTAGSSGVDFITLCDAEDLPVKIAGEVKGFDPAQYVDRKTARRMDRFTQFAVAASLEAVERASLRLDSSNRDDVGVLIGSGMGGLITLSEQFRVLWEKGADRVSPFLVPMMIIDIASGQVSMTLGARGLNYGVVSACASGAHAIGEAFRVIRQGEAKAMIAGGTDATITPIAIAGFAAMGALSRRNWEPSQVSRPFDAERDGFVMSEGAAVLVLESLDFALERGAPILAEIAGYGATGDAYHICEMPDDGEGAARAMRAALRQAGMEPEQIDYINAHGSSTRLNDKSETIAIKSVFGEHAYKVPISSTKSMLGHLMGAAGAIEALISVQAIQEGIIPPTINLEKPDPECDLDYVPNAARQREVKAALSNSFGFGGHNAALIFASPADL